MAKLVLLFTLVPLIELYLLLYLGRVLGFWPTVAIVLTTALTGATLARMQGARVLARWREALARGTMPEEGVLEGVLVLLGGVLLVTPGVLTDVVGLSLLVPVTRALWARALRRWLERRVARGDVQVVSVGTMSAAFDARTRGASRAGGARPVPGAVIDVEGYEVPADVATPATRDALPGAGDDG